MFFFTYYKSNPLVEVPNSYISIHEKEKCSRSGCSLYISQHASLVHACNPNIEDSTFCSTLSSVDNITIKDGNSNLNLEGLIEKSRCNSVLLSVPVNSLSEFESNGERRLFLDKGAKDSKNEKEILSNVVSGIYLHKSTYDDVDTNIITRRTIIDVNKVIPNAIKVGNEPTRTLNPLPWNSPVFMTSSIEATLHGQDRLYNFKGKTNLGPYLAASSLCYIPGDSIIRNSNELINQFNYICDSYIFPFSSSVLESKLLCEIRNFYNANYKSIFKDISDNLDDTIINISKKFSKINTDLRFDLSNNNKNLSNLNNLTNPIIEILSETINNLLICESNDVSLCLLDLITLCSMDVLTTTNIMSLKDLFRSSAFVKGKQRLADEELYEEISSSPITRLATRPLARSINDLLRRHSSGIVSAESRIKYLRSAIREIFKFGSTARIRLDRYIKITQNFYGIIVQDKVHNAMVASIMNKLKIILDIIIGCITRVSERRACVIEREMAVDHVTLDLFLLAIDKEQ